VFGDIDYEFVSEAPFLIEEQLKDLFSNFLSELLGTMDTFPGTLLESCVACLNTTISSSVQDIIRSEIIPSLFQKVMNHVLKFSTLPDKENIVNSALSNKLDSLQDTILGMHSIQEEKIGKLSSDFHHMEDQLRDQVLDLKQRLLESQKREQELLEQVRRRLGDISSISAAIKETISQGAADKKHIRENNPPPRYNNPLMNEHSHSPSEVREAFCNRQYPSKRTAAETPGPPLHPRNLPQWQIEFPFIHQDHVDVEMRKELWKSIPKTSEWEKFSGELPYNHELWLKNIDVFVQDYCMLNHMIISRLTALFTDTAKNWYIGIRDSHENRSWAWWKNTIRNKFGTHNWKWKM
jgi:hypothetical protein